MIWVVGVLALLALAGVTFYLIFLNWNQQLGATLLSVALGGTVTLFIAVFSQLKESTVTAQFAVEIPFDSSSGLPVFGGGSHAKDDPGLRHAMWLSAMHRIAVQPHMPAPRPGQSVTFDAASIAKPVTADEMFALCGQLMQYKLLEDLRDYGPSSRPPIVVDGREVPSIQTPTPPGPVVDYPEEKVRELLASNHMSSGSGAMWWEHRTLRVPPDAQISLLHVPSSEATGVTKDLIVVERPTYFRVVISVEPLGAGGSGTSPIKTVRVAVSMKATFFKMAAGSSYSAGAKSWCEWLFKMLEEVNAS